MAYDIGTLSLEALIGPTARATEALARLDERLVRSLVRVGWIERQHFIDACASMWLEGELVHIEDLVLHDAHMDIRTPTHELTRAHSVLRARRQIFAQKPDWALSGQGLPQLTRRGLSQDSKSNGSNGPADHERSPRDESLGADRGGPDELSRALELIDAALLRSSKVLDGQGNRDGDQRTRFEERSELVYDQDWDEDARLRQWQDVATQTEALPVALRAAILTDAWREIDVLQRASWLGSLLIAALLRQQGIAAHHLPSLHLGAKQIPRERRRASDLTLRLIAALDAIHAAANLGLKEHDRLLLGKSQMERRLGERRSNSKLPELIELVLSRPLVSSGMIQQALKVSKQGALNLVDELGLREMTGRGRFRAWGLL